MQVFDPRQIHVPSGHFIGGRLVPDAGGMSVQRPSDGQPHAELPLADAATVDTAVRDAWSAWRHRDWSRRAPRAARRANARACCADGPT